MNNKWAYLLNIVIGIFFFIFYVTIVNSILSHDVLNFPYIILTVYFFISIFTLTPVSTELGRKTKDWNSIIASYTIIVAYLISPIWVLIKSFKDEDE